MPDYQAPGAHVQDGGHGPRPIEGVATAVAGFVGEAQRGPTAPTPITSWMEYQREFGGFLDQALPATPLWRLPYAVRGFFDNGGQRCYIGRVVGAPTPGGHAPVTLTEIVGDAVAPEERTGIAGLMAVDEIAVMAVPDAVEEPAFGDALIDRCEAARDRIAILDDSSGSADPAVIGRHRLTSWAALYVPRLRVPAPHLPAGHTVVPACGHVAGVIARVDGTRGVHKAPANEPLRGLWHPHAAGDPGPLEPVVGPRVHEVLAPLGVNAIRDLSGHGLDVRVWGARTMTPQGPWKYLSVRRLFIFLEQSLHRGTAWAAFEASAEPTWARVREAVEQFLFDVWRRGSLAGTTASEAFFVRCDRSTMTQADIDHGRLIVLAGAAPLKPAEFVIFRVSQQTAGST